MTTSNLFPCPDCGRECSFAALACPNCGRPFPQPPSPPDTHASDAFHTRLFDQSAARVGLCLTLVGMLRIVEGVKQAKYLADELLVMAALGFLVSGLISHFALRETDTGNKHRLGKISNSIFTVAFCVLAIICIVVILESVY